MYINLICRRQYRAQGKKNTIEVNMSKPIINIKYEKEHINGNVKLPLINY